MKSLVLAIMLVCLFPLVASAQCANGVCRARPAVRVLVRTPSTKVNVVVPEGRVSYGFMHAGERMRIWRPFSRMRVRR
jgi:hypothetical protein